LREVTRSGAHATSRIDRGSPVAPAVALLVAILAFLPLVNWIPDGYKFPEYGSKLVQWTSGTGIAVGAGIVLAILAREAQWLWPGAAVERAGTRIDHAPGRVVVITAIVAGCLYLSVAHWIFHGRPLLIDEIVEERQAQIFAAGRLWLPTPPHPEFFSSLHMVDVGGRVYSQFPPGGPALLALGVLAGATWLVVPLCAVVSVLAFAVIVRVAEPNVRIAVAAIALFAIAPFTVFMSGSHMNHVTALTCILVGAAALVRATARPGADGGRVGLAFVSGLGFGAAATIRPVDALAFAAPAAVWYTWRALRTPRRWVDALAALAGVAIPMCAMFYVNAQTTGAALLFGYQVLWGKDHDLGFHQAPWGGAHTPGRGLELINLYFLRLQDYLYETPVPALVPAIGALALTKRLRPIDRYLLASCGLITILYFAYWADGNYLGPRFVYTLGPVAALWTARFPTLLRDWLRRSRLRTAVSTFVYRVSMYGLATSALVAVCIGITFRTRQYRQNFATERWATPQVATQSGVRNALVFVREGWVEQLVVRMWALGVSHPHVETLYRAVDPCRLDSAVTALERNTSGGARTDATLYPMLAPLLRDSDAVEPVRVGLAGVKLHMQRGYPYPAHCLRRVEEVAAGISPLAPLLAVEGSDGNVYARDLHARDTLLLAAYPSRPIYTVHPASPARSALPAFFPVSRDSLVRAWRDEARADSAPDLMRRILVPAQAAPLDARPDSSDATPPT
jgi:hypothetical protein